MQQVPRCVRASQKCEHKGKLKQIDFGQIAEGDSSSLGVGDGRATEAGERARSCGR